MKKIYYLLALCAFSFQGFAQPANDNCSGAIALTVNPYNSCAAVTAGSLAGATDSGEGDNGAGTPNDDVWYSFVATGPTQIISLLNVTGTPTDLVHEVLEGNCGGGLTSLKISDPNNSVVSGLTQGTTYYLRVFSYGAAAATSTAFNVCIASTPPAPANDNCTSAVALTVNPNLSCGSVTTGTLSGATDSGEGDNGGGVPNDDVWYTFVATATTHYFSLLNVTGTVTDLMHEVLEGNCGGGLVSLGLSDPNSSSVSGLTVGNTYYVRVFSYQADPSFSTNFSLCVGSPPPPPANDNCNAAVTVSVNTAYSCTNVTAGTLAGATDSGEGDNGAGTPNDDVWFTFVATSTTQRISLLNVAGDQTDLVHELLEGNCGGGLTSINISDADTSNVTGLTVGNTYYVRVFSYGTTASLSTTFNLCVTAPPPPPANDDCANAVALTVNPTLACAAVTHGTLGGATDSGEGDNGAGLPNDDVWYTFVATADTHIISLKNITGVPTDLMIEVLTGNCGGGLTSVALSDPETATVTGLTAGSSYYVRIFSYRALAAESTAFDLCIGTPPVLTNDSCADAIALTVNPDFNCGTVTSGTLVGATDSGEGDNGAGLPSDDVWYTFVATAASQRISIIDVLGTPTDVVHEILQGNCGGALTSVLVSDANTSNPTGLTIGNTYYVRVFSYQDAPATSTIFNICVGTPPPPPANDECSGAIALTPRGSYAAGAVPATVVGATNSATTNPTIPAPACSFGFAGGDVWYTTTIPASGNLTIETGANSGITTFDSVVAVYSGTCDALTSVSCDDDGADTANFSKLVITGRTPGEVIYLRVYEYNNDESEPFSISVYDSSLASTTFDSAKFSAHPNPVTDILNLSYTKNISDVQVYNLLGQQVITKTVNNREDKLDMSHLPSGTYMVKVTAEGQTKTIKVLKK